jgi:hypothetical protein
MSAEKKTKIVSLSLDPDMHELIKSSAKKLGHKNVSQLVRDLVSRYLFLMVNDKDEIPVILHIPGEFKGDRGRLKEWLDRKSDAIVEALS